MTDTRWSQFLLWHNYEQISDNAFLPGTCTFFFVSIRTFYICNIISEVSMPSRAWVASCHRTIIIFSTKFQCPHGLELHLKFFIDFPKFVQCFNALTGLSCIITYCWPTATGIVSMPSRAWVESLLYAHQISWDLVSMPSRAWVASRTY